MKDNTWNKGLGDNLKLAKAEAGAKHVDIIHADLFDTDGLAAKQTAF